MVFGQSVTAFECTALLIVLYVTTRIAFLLLTFIYKRLLCSPIDIRKKFCGGKWAIVTGSTDGIGKSYAFAMAERGLNVVLISRNPSKLEAVAEEISTKHAYVKTKCITVDFAKDDVNLYKDKIFKEIDELEIGVLINNVGMGYEMPDDFLAVSDLVEDLVKTNITSCNSMISLVLPKMIGRECGGVIINISSYSGALPTPLLSAYSGTKAYVDMLSRGLAVEYAEKGITVQCVLPGYVVTKMSKLRKSSIIAPYPDAFVSSALSRLGIESRTSGYWSHDLMLWATSSILPETCITNLTYKHLKGIRAKALKKKQK